MHRSTTIVSSGVILTCFAAAIGLQIRRDRSYPRADRETEQIMYVRSGGAMKRLTLDFDALAADIYWIRAIQHYGGDRRTETKRRKYALLFPLLDHTTTLDPYFKIAYRFGAIFLSEQYPGGAGRPDQGIALLQKGMAAQPTKWEYPHDIAFVYYWHLRDFKTAAEWFQRAAALPTAPNWLQPLAAGILTAGNDRAAARLLWSQILQSDEEWLRRNAERSLKQIDALDLIDRLQARVNQFPPPPGGQYSWIELVRRRALPGIPLDPVGTPFEIDPATGVVSVSERSSLYPMPDRMHAPK
jgi:hypothetical protein